MVTESSILPFEVKDFSTLVEGMLEDMGQGKLTDKTEGSVVRTLAEVFARELAVCYQQLDKVYRFGFLDTAEGVALDNVVALLGVKRYQPGHVEGRVTFARRQPAPDDINIIAGTLVTGRDVAQFQVLRRVTLKKGDTEIDAEIRSVESGVDGVEPRKLVVLPRPIWGIETVTNQSKLILRQNKETDDELRERSRYTLHKTNLGTVSALEIAVRSQGIEQVSVQEQIEDKPGQIEITLGDTQISDNLLEQVKIAIEEVRPAGIRVRVASATRIWLRLYAKLELDKEYLAYKKEEIIAEAEQALERYVSSLGNGDRLRWSKVRSILSNHDSVVEIYPGDEAIDFFQVFMRKNGVENDVASEYLGRNHDVIVGSTERVGLDTKRKAIRLVVEPPFKDVWLDVVLSSTSNGGADDVIASVSSRLNEALSMIEEGDAFSYQALKEAAGVDIKCFEVTHDGSARVLIMNEEGDSDQLATRERIQLRRVFYDDAS